MSCFQAYKLICKGGEIKGLHQPGQIVLSKSPDSFPWLTDVTSTGTAITLPKAVCIENDRGTIASLQKAGCNAEKL